MLANTSVAIPGTNEFYSLGDEWLSRAITARDIAVQACYWEYHDYEVLAGGMAKNIRNEDADQSDVRARIKSEIRVEALRQEENCLYTSTAIYSWLKTVKIHHAIVVLAPILLTGVTGFIYLKDMLPAWTGGTRRLAVHIDTISREGVRFRDS